ncbi:MAG: response regulator [Arcobacteraceae bacterium]|nr:response regulator [Arcobacteraceae bacterium]
MNKTKISNKFFITISLVTLAVLVISVLISFKVMDEIKIDNYKLINKNALTTLDNKLAAKMEVGITNAVSVASNADILLAISENDKDLAYEVLTDIIKKYQKFTEFKNVKVHIHTADVKSFLRSWLREKNGDDLSSFRHTINEVKKIKEPVSAIEVGVVGLILRSIVPIVDEFGYNGSLEYLQGFEHIVKSYKKDDKYLLVFVKKDLLLKTTNKDKAAHNLILSQNEYNLDFFKDFKKINLNKLLKIGYLDDDKYFYSIKPIISFSNKVIGYYVLGENIESAQKIVKQSQEVVYIFIAILFLLSIIIIVAVNISLKKLVINNLYKVSDGLSSFFKYLNKESDKVEQIKVLTNDEIGQMAHKVNSNIKTIQTLIDQENKQDWIKDGLSGLNNTLSGNNDITSVCNDSISYLCEYLKAGIGALYIHDKEEDLLHLYGTYAFVQRKDLSSIFKVGEGTVGQVALQKTPIQLENIIRTHMVISTGTTNEAPLNTYTFPLIYQEELYGVIEIGSTSLFNKTQREFFQLADTVVATKIFSAIQNKKVKDLLFESQETNTKLQKQRTELEEANAQMQEQQAQLEEANSQMQEQQAQLEEANAQMEEQQVQLQESEKELKIQNSQLEISKEQLKIKAKDLEDSNTYKSEFLANMSHELRTPLNSVILLSSMLGQNKKQNLNKDDMKKAQIINSSGEDLLRLINDVLDLSKVEAGRMDLIVDDFHSSQFIQKIKDMFEPSIQNNGLEFIIEDSYNDIIKTDEDKLSQVIKNFLSNSLKFTHKGNIKLIIESEGSNKVKISVKDTGIGIATDKQELVFKAFSQADGSTSRKYGGTGLGLSITKELVKLMGGTVFLESQEGIGSTFSIVIPNLTKNKELEKPKQEVLKIVPSNMQKQINNIIIDDSEKIISTDKPFLIIEDNEAFALTLKSVINEKGNYALIATTGQKGLNLANRYKNIQGILLDLGLPDIDGIDVLKELKTNISTRKLPVYIISGHNKQNDIRLMGAVGFKQKPLSNNDLENVFNDFSKFNNKKIKDLLVVEDDKIQREAMIEFIGNNTISSKGVDNIDVAKKELDKGIYDAIVVDLSLNGKSGLEICEYIKSNKLNIPIIVYTGKELTAQEEKKIKKYTDSIIVKSANSQHRLLDEVDMFLHRVKTATTQSSKNIIASDINFDDKKIMVVDDDMRNTFVLVEILEERGANVLTASTGKEALEILNKNLDTNIILMDIMMPVMDGYEAIKSIRANKDTKDIPIIAVTAKAMAKDKEKCLEVGANDFLTKPLNLETFVSIVKAWIT